MEIADSNNIKSNTVCLEFPHAMFDNQTADKFMISFSSAIKSEFLQHLLEQEYDESDEVVFLEESKDNDEKIKRRYTIEIPFTFYRGMNYNDLLKFIRIWNGSESYIHNDIYTNYNGKLMAKLSQALVLSDDLSFACRLESSWPPYPVVGS
tara:strand:- start:918 stop:1370 length:453 start_codon:yes stop_codon:yes gene_type:complete